MWHAILTTTLRINYLGVSKCPPPQALRPPSNQSAYSSTCPSPPKLPIRPQTSAAETITTGRSSFSSRSHCGPENGTLGFFEFLFLPLSSYLRQKNLCTQKNPPSVRPSQRCNVWHVTGSGHVPPISMHQAADHGPPRRRCPRRRSGFSAPWRKFAGGGGRT